MNWNALHWLRHSLVAVAAAALLAGCDGSTPTGPASSPLTPASASGISTKTVDLGSCDDLRAPAGSTVTFHAYARGVQIYRWDGATWTLVGPSATLYADAAGQAEVGTHYTGPTWRSTSGSTVVGVVGERCTPSADAIPWLSLSAVSTQGSGVFQGVGYIQRVNTAGGKAPVEAGTYANELKGVSYTAEYFFYRSQEQA